MIPQTIENVQYDCRITTGGSVVHDQIICITRKHLTYFGIIYFEHHTGTGYKGVFSGVP
jgi:hypothetical protein